MLLDSVSEFIYFGSNVTTAASTISIWVKYGGRVIQVSSQSLASIRPALRVLDFYCAWPWTLLKADVNCLEAFHMRSLRRILGIRWFDHATNVG